MISGSHLPAACKRYPQEKCSVTSSEALACVALHALELESGRGPVPSLAAIVAGEPIRGSWWAHERAREIFSLTRALSSCPDVLVCRLVDGKITSVNRRLWPAAVRLEKRFSRADLAWLHEVHPASGKHTLEETRFPAWVCAETATQAAKLDAAAALDPRCAKASPHRKPGRARPSSLKQRCWPISWTAQLSARVRARGPCCRRRSSHCRTNP
jgi:hypothetical protein